MERDLQIVETKTRGKYNYTVENQQNIYQSIPRGMVYKIYSQNKKKHNWIITFRPMHCSSRFVEENLEWNKEIRKSTHPHLQGKIILFQYDKSDEKHGIKNAQRNDLFPILMADMPRRK